MLTANTFPIKLSEVKSAYGTSVTLANYKAGGTGGVKTGSVGKNGFVPSTGTIKLSDLRGVTHVNVASSIANSQILLQADSEDSGGVSSSCYLRLVANTASGGANNANLGILQARVDGYIVTANVPYGVGFAYANIPNAWLFGTNKPVDPDYLNNGYYDVLWSPRVRNIGGNGGTTQMLDLVANTWVNLDGTKQPTLAASSISSGIGGFDNDSASYAGYLAIRMNTSPQTVLTNTYIVLVATSSAFPP